MMDAHPRQALDKLLTDVAVQHRMVNCVFVGKSIGFLSARAPEEAKPAFLP
jgi:hypothetical protein